MKSAIVHDLTEPLSLEGGPMPEPPRGEALEVETAGPQRFSSRGRCLNVVQTW
jgi:hypothetical protein